MLVFCLKGCKFVCVLSGKPMRYDEANVFAICLRYVQRYTSLQKVVDKCFVSIITELISMVSIV